MNEQLPKRRIGSDGSGAWHGLKKVTKGQFQGKAVDLDGVAGANPGSFRCGLSVDERGELASAMLNPGPPTACADLAVFA